MNSSSRCPRRWHPKDAGIARSLRWSFCPCVRPSHRQAESERGLVPIHQIDDLRAVGFEQVVGRDENFVAPDATANTQRRLSASWRASLTCALGLLQPGDGGLGLADVGQIVLCQPCRICPTVPCPKSRLPGVTPQRLRREGVDITPRLGV